MKPSTNIALLAIVAIVAMAGERLLVSPQVAQQETPGTLEGEVLAVDPPADDGTASLARKATIKLRGGEVVQASVGGCVIFPGQTTRVSRMAGYLKTVYVVAENGR